MKPWIVTCLVALLLCAGGAMAEAPAVVLRDGTPVDTFPLAFPPERDAAGGFTFQGVPWGADPETVEGLLGLTLGDALFTVAGQAVYLPQATRAAWDGAHGMLSLTFADGGLSDVGVSRTDSLARTDYEGYVAVLTEAFGPPEVRETEDRVRCRWMAPGADGLQTALGMDYAGGRVSLWYVRYPWSEPPP